jgi:hypothetical protein
MMTLILKFQLICIHTRIYRLQRLIGRQAPAKMPQYLLRLSLEHPTFRLPSLKSIADLYEFPIRFVSEDKLRSVLVVELEKDEDAEKFLERGVLVM